MKLNFNLTVFTYREMMELVLKYNGRWRPIVSLPFGIGMMQGLILEQLPLNLFTVTRAQVSRMQPDVCSLTYQI